MTEHTGQETIEGETEHSVTAKTTDPVELIETDALPSTRFGRGMRRMLAAFAYRDFRVQWIGACSSAIGTWMQIIAQNWLVLSLTNSPFYLGLDAFLQQLPIILCSRSSAACSPIATTVARRCWHRSTFRCSRQARSPS
jgi:hypothetical protein